MSDVSAANLTVLRGLLTGGRSDVWQ